MKNQNNNKIVIKNKKEIVIAIGIIAILIIAILLLCNEETRNNIISSLNAKASNSKTEEIEVFDDGSAILTDDSAIITSAGVSSRTTGTAPFDENDDPGNDSSESNNVIRSFDKVTWNIEANIGINNTGHGSEEANQYTQFRGGIINIEASLPEEYAGLMKWSVEDMSWANGTGILSEDGLTFTAQYQMSEEIITVPGK